MEALARKPQDPKRSEKGTWLCPKSYHAQNRSLYNDINHHFPSEIATIWVNNKYMYDLYVYIWDMIINMCIFWDMYIFGICNKYMCIHIHIYIYVYTYPKFRHIRIDHVLAI